jgi:hypothetical protein
MKKVSIINVHIKICKSNFFLIISTGFGKSLLSTNSGYLGFKNIQKRSVEAFNKVLMFGIKFLYSFKRNYYAFFYFENVKKSKLAKIYKAFIKKLKIKFLGFSMINKIPHNGCKK